MNDSDFVNCVILKLEDLKIWRELIEAIPELAELIEEKEE